MKLHSVKIVQAPPCVPRACRSGDWRDRQAVVHWVEALVEAERLSAYPELARTHATLASRLASGEVERIAGLDAAGHAQEARALFERLGLTAESTLDTGVSALG